MKENVKQELKQLVVDTGLEMVRTGMTVGTWGNISVRDPETNFMYISPSGMDYLIIKPQHIVVLTLDLEVVDGTAEPSVEKHMHAAVYRARPDVNAVVHTHPVFSSVFGAVKMELPAVSEDFAQIVGDRVGYAEPYELPGTPALGVSAVRALGQHNAVLLPNHGALSVGETMKKALKVSMVLEKNAQIYLFAKLIGTPTLFKDKDIEAMQNFAKNYYGKKNQSLT
ncbi:MAG TPA: class II aldolase/adducin family protein [Spirochaetia bacterium]|jgi:L-fuculose-phosphate aldolase|nr:class II aldolase/adducin family protein [Spirochaetia bacterium]